MSTNVLKNINTLQKQSHMGERFNVTFKNGKKNTVYLYPRTYVELANKYINTKVLAPYLISSNSVNWESLQQYNKQRAKMRLNSNYMIMRKEWKSWINRNFTYSTGDWVKRVPQIKTFIEKSLREQQTPQVKYVNGKYVKVPTMRNRAAYVLKHVRERKQRLAKIKEALKYAVNYEKTKKRWASTSLMRFPSQNYPNY